jgi:hypothetical protein
LIKLTGAESVCKEFKPLSTVPVSILAPIVPAPTAESRAAGWLNQRWDGMRTVDAHDALRQAGVCVTLVNIRWATLKAT